MLYQKTFFNCLKRTKHRNQRRAPLSVTSTEANDEALAYNTVATEQSYFIDIGTFYMPNHHMPTEHNMKGQKELLRLLNNNTKPRKEVKSSHQQTNPICI